MRFLPLGLLILLFSACLDQPDCLVTSTNKAVISFKKIGTINDTVVTISSVTLRGTDSVFYRDKKAPSVSLPVNASATQVTYRFSFPTRTDTLQLGYTPQNVILGPECGAFVFYTNLVVLSTSFANVRVITNQLTKGDKIVNVEIKL